MLLLGILALSLLNVATAKNTTCKRVTVTDNFHKLDPSIWSLEVGSRKQLSYGSKGLVMTLNQKADNIVLATKQRFALPYSFTITQQASAAPGIVSTAITRLGDGSDEVDLEIVGKTPRSLQTVLWRRAKRGYYDFSNAPKGIEPTKQFVTYTVSLTSTTFSLAVNGKTVRTHKRAKGEIWPTQALPFKMGPWASQSGNDWAGVLNWKKNPAPKQAIKSLKIVGCAA